MTPSADDWKSLCASPRCGRQVEREPVVLRLTADDAVALAAD
jgi:hypothetical protein